MARAIQTVTEATGARQGAGKGATCPRRNSVRSSRRSGPAFLRTRSGELLGFSPCPPIGRRGSTLASMCREGEDVSVFATGRAYLSRESTLELLVLVLSWRTGRPLPWHPVFPYVYCYLLHGHLFLAGAFPGEWTTRTGDLSTPAEVYQQTEGGVVVLVVRWAVPALEGLRRLAQFGDVGRFLSSEIDRLETPLNQPEGWQYPWHVGPGEMYTAVPRPSPATGDRLLHARRGDESAERCRFFAFTPETRVRWSWKMDQLPSQIREDSVTDARLPQPRGRVRQ